MTTPEMRSDVGAEVEESEVSDSGDPGADLAVAQAPSWCLLSGPHLSDRPQRRDGMAWDSDGELRWRAYSARSRFTPERGDVVALRLVNRGAGSAMLEDVEVLDRSSGWILDLITLRAAPGLDSETVFDARVDELVEASSQLDRERRPTRRVGRVLTALSLATMSPEGYIDFPLVERGGWISVRLRRDPRLADLADPNGQSPGSEVAVIVESRTRSPIVQLDPEVEIQLDHGSPYLVVGGVLAGVADREPSGTVLEIASAPPRAIFVRGHLTTLGRLYVASTVAVESVADLVGAYVTVRWVPAGPGRAPALEVAAVDVMRDAAERCARVSRVAAWRWRPGDDRDPLPISDAMAAKMSGSDLGATLVAEVHHDHRAHRPYVTPDGCVICERHASVEMMCLSLASFRNVEGHSGYGRPGAVVGEVARAWQRIATAVGVSRAELRLPVVRRLFNDGSVVLVSVVRWTLRESRLLTRIEVTAPPARLPYLSRMQVTVVAALDATALAGPLDGARRIGDRPRMLERRHSAVLSEDRWEPAVVELSGAACAAGGLVEVTVEVTASDYLEDEASFDSVTLEIALFSGEPQCATSPAREAHEAHEEQP